MRKQRQGWMCSVEFDYEVGQAIGGSTVYPSKKDLRQNRACIDSDEFCKAKRVYVIDADIYDAFCKRVEAK